QPTANQSGYSHHHALKPKAIPSSHSASSAKEIVNHNTAAQSSTCMTPRLIIDHLDSHRLAVLEVHTHDVASVQPHRVDGKPRVICRFVTPNRRVFVNQHVAAHAFRYVLQVFIFTARVVGVSSV